MKPDDHIIRTAVIEGEYRYLLSRVWDRALPKRLYIMLNPSTADGEDDDPTIRRCTGFAVLHGFGGYDVVNLYALRATDPSTVAKHPTPVGPENDDWIMRTARDAGEVVAAWGAQPFLRARGRTVTQGLLRAGIRLRALGAPTAAGHPRHPLFLPYNAELRDWSGYN